MDLVGLCRAYVDLLAPVTEEELAALGVEKGGDLLLTPEELRHYVERFLPISTILPGGPVANSVAVISALGGTAGYIGRVGEDELGQRFVAGFDRRTVALRCETAPGGATGTCVILITPDGERTILYNLGVVDDIRTEDLFALESDIREAKIVFLGLSLRNPKISPLLRCVRELSPKARIATTLQGCTSESDLTVLAKLVLETDIVLGNQAEYATLTSTGLVPSILELSRKRLIVCTAGADGAEIVSTGESVLIPASPVANLVDTTGAGDAWAGGFLYGLSQGRTLEQSGLLGAKCAAEILGVVGGRPRSSMLSLLDTPSN